MFARYKSAVDKLALAMCLPLIVEAIATIKIHTYENNNGCQRTDHPAVLRGAADSSLKMIKAVQGEISTGYPADRVFCLLFVVMTAHAAILRSACDYHS